MSVNAAATPDPLEKALNDTFEGIAFARILDKRLLTSARFSPIG